MTLLCASPRCRVPGRHLDTCQAQTCRGCAPAYAHDGLQLCWHCTQAIGRNARKVAWLWYEIGEQLAAAGSTGVPVRNPHPGLVLSPAAAQMRTEIRHVLVSWVKLICEERGLQPPRDESQHNLGATIALHGQWLAATAYADEAADELAQLRGRAWATAYPDGVSVRLIGPCPERDDAPDAPDPTAPCPGNVKAHMRRADSLLPDKVVCDLNTRHEWIAEHWRVLGRGMGHLLEGYLPVEVVATATGRSVTSIYRTASQCRWRRVLDGRRVRYDAADVADTFGWVT